MLVCAVSERECVREHPYSHPAVQAQILALQEREARRESEQALEREKDELLRQISELQQRQVCV